jgi:hypothetical protein
VGGVATLDARSKFCRSGLHLLVAGDRMFDAVAMCGDDLSVCEDERIWESQLHRRLGHPVLSAT